MNCTHCGAPMTGRKRLYCDSTCSMRAYNARRKADGRLAQQRIDGQALRSQWMADNRKRYQEERACVVCGETFVAQKQKPASVCSPACRTMRDFGCIYPKKPPAPIMDKVCMWCAGTFSTPRVGAKYCSDKHAEAARKHRYRIAHGEWTIERSVRLAIYERDGYKCHLCGDPVDTTKADPQANMYPSLDHLIPRSLGGSDDETNLATAHRICNSLRRDLPLVR